MAIRVIEPILCEAYTKAEEIIVSEAECVYVSILHMIQCVFSVRHMLNL